MKNKTVLITGGAKGIGKAVALRFAAEGANIALNYRSTLPASVIEEIEENGVTCLPIQGDVGTFAEAESIVSRVREKFGSLDVLVNNAGITRDSLLMRMTEDEFDQVIRTNLKGAFNTTRFAAGIMLKQKSGAIINISSVVGIKGNAGQVNYAASKAGIIGLTKSTARELASRGITCNAIAPGFIETDMTAGLSGDIRNKLLAEIPLKRFGEAIDIAEAAVFLARNRYITGQVLGIDGGMSM